MKHLICSVLVCLVLAGYLQAAETPPYIELERHPADFNLRSVAFSPNSSLVIVSRRHSVCFFEAESGKLLRTLEMQTIPDITTAFSSDSKKIGSTEILRENQKILTVGVLDNVARIWDIESGEELKKLEGHEGLIGIASFLSGGKKVLTASRDGTVRIWDVESGKELQKSNWKGIAPYFSPDGTLYATQVETNNFTHQIRDTSSGKVLHTINGPFVAFSPDGQKIATTGGWSMSGRGSLIYDVKSGEVLKELEDTLFDFSLDWKKCATVHVREGMAGDDGEITTRILDTESWRTLSRIDGRFLAFSPDGSKVITLGDRFVIRMWDVESGKELYKFDHSISGKRTHVRFSPDGKKVVLASDNGIIRVWTFEE